MSISTAAKIGGAALASGGVPATSFVVYDSFFSLYKVEKEVLDSTEDLLIEKDTDSSTTDSKIMYLKIFKESSWKCIVKAVATEDNPSLEDSKSDLIDLIKNNLPKKNDSDDDKKLEKQRNKKNLIKNCSKNRKSDEEQSDLKVISEITVALKKKTVTEGTTSNKWTFEDESLGQLFGKGFWI